MPINQPPPQNLEAEEAVIASCIIDQSAVPKAVDLISPDDFYRRAHQIIFEGIKHLHSKSEPCDLVSLTTYLSDMKQLGDIGGASYLAKMSDRAPLAVNIQSYAKMVKDKSVRRQIINKAHETIQSAYEGDSAEAVLDAAQSTMMGVKYDGFEQTSIPMCDVIDERLDHLERISQTHEVTGIPAGYSIDDLTCGFQPSDLIIIAARPSMGKTALAINMAENMANTGRAVDVYSLEMSKGQLGNRALSSQSRVDGFRFISGCLDRNHWQKISDAASRMSDWKMHIDDTPSLHYSALRRKVRRNKKMYGTEIVIIDYLQLMSGDSQANRHGEIGSITRNLKAMAKELNIPVIALSQLNRNLENRPDKRPKLSDLKESGDIEQDADLVISIYRDEVYNRDKDNPSKGIAEITILKHRNGKTGFKKMVWLEAFTRFENMSDRRDRE